MEREAFEIERKFLIRRPDERWLAENTDRSEIVQTYLIRPEGGGRARVRKRTQDGVTVYTHTVKQRVNDLRALEAEREIDAEEYARLLLKADPKRETLIKTRCCLPYHGQIFEIDLYPFWEDQAVMEIELTDETQTVDFPPEIKLIREVSSEREFSNASLAKWLAETNAQKGRTR